MADILHMVSVISFVSAGVFAIVAIVLWFAFKIPSIVGDLSGRTARKSIEKMRENNEKIGNKAYKVSEINLERGKLTETIERERKSSAGNDETGLLNENQVKKYEGNATELLADDATGLLSELQETASLVEEIETVVRPPATVSVQILGEVMLVHTEEVI